MHVEQSFVSGPNLSGYPLSCGSPSADTEKILRVAPQSDLVILDPIWSPAYVTRNHGYMIYDTLFGMDAEGPIQPQTLARSWKLRRDAVSSLARVAPRRNRMAFLSR